MEQNTTENLLQEDWIKTSEEIPELGQMVVIYYTGYPKTLEDDYELNSHVIPVLPDKIELECRAKSRLWHKNNPFKIAYLQDVFKGKKWVIPIPRDSKQYNDADLLDVKYWKPLHAPIK